MLLTSEFPRANKTGWRRDCKVCFNFSNREKWRKNHPNAAKHNAASKPPVPTIDVESAINLEKEQKFLLERYHNGDKKCSICHLFKPTIEYYRAVDTRDGYMAHCKFCHERSEKERRLHLAKPWLRTYSNAKTRAKKLAVPFSLTREDIRRLYEVGDGICPVLKTPMHVGGYLQSVPSLDRIRPELGYVHGNVRLISFRANSLKQDATPEELRLVLKDLESVALDTTLSSMA